MPKRDPSLCAKCDSKHDGWPADQCAGELCQMCWEAKCSDSWWRAHTPTAPPQGGVDA